MAGGDPYLTSSDLSEDENDGLIDSDPEWRALRQDVAWRWKWLELKIAEMQKLSQTFETQRQKSRELKLQNIPILQERDTQQRLHALRTTGVRRRRLKRRILTPLPRSQPQGVS
eukprot:gnl/Spiro4/672_TR379_c1_g4_i1.p1 gnl/Spiro4/672_TR379_c1_g4~~gnl/Spiro4/672_TR379_c1_g4_i1.p1  ORF type:complete len:114 (-),score=23.69 gnl/Spiro4/672_TR379_c1_g4_i1:121-462(-)